MIILITVASASEYDHHLVGTQLDYVGFFLLGADWSIPRIIFVKVFLGI